MAPDIWKNVPRKEREGFPVEFRFPDSSESSMSALEESMHDQYHV